MTIFCVGMSYEHAPMDALEGLVFPADAQVGILREICGHPGVLGALVLSTCNRFEIYLETRDSGCAVDPAGVVVDAVGAAVAGHLVVRRDMCALEHLCAVACGLKSMAVGEREIVAQLRRAARLATPMMSPGLARVVDTALRTSRHARGETGLGRSAASLLEAGLDVAARALGGFGGRTALVVGAGVVGRHAGAVLKERGIGRILVANRSRGPAERLAAAVGGAVVEPGEALGECDLVVAAVRAPEPVLTAEVVGPAAPLFVLDLGVPRNVDPGCHEIDGVTVVDVDGLGRRLAARILPGEVDRARAIVAADAAAYAARQAGRTADPLIILLRDRARRVLEAELGRLRRRLPGLDEQVLDETATTVHRVVGKLLHEPTVRAKELSATPEGEVYLAALARLYGAHLEEANV